MLLRKKNEGEIAFGYKKKKGDKRAVVQMMTIEIKACTVGGCSQWQLKTGD